VWGGEFANREVKRKKGKEKRMTNISTIGNARGGDDRGFLWGEGGKPINRQGTILSDV